MKKQLLEVEKVNRTTKQTIKQLTNQKQLL
jgi:hypothetical protein